MSSPKTLRERLYGSPVRRTGRKAHRQLLCPPGGRTLRGLVTGTLADERGSCRSGPAFLSVYSKRTVCSLRLVYLEVWVLHYFFLGTTTTHGKERKLEWGRRRPGVCHRGPHPAPRPLTCALSLHRPHIKMIFQGIAAKVGTGEPCCDWASAGLPFQPGRKWHGCDQVHRATRAPPGSQWVALWHKAAQSFKSLTTGT